MVLRFEVNQAEAFRRGVNIPKSIVHLDIDPATLEQGQRELIADRLNGIDVHELRIAQHSGMHTGVGVIEAGTIYKAFKNDGEPIRIEAHLHNWDELLLAVRRNEARVKREFDEMVAGNPNLKADETHWQNRAPYVVFDPLTEAEWVTPKVLRYYVVNVNNRWSICDRFTDLIVAGTESDKRDTTIWLFYQLHGRKIPEGLRLPKPVNGTKHNGIG